MLIPYLAGFLNLTLNLILFLSKNVISEKSMYDVKNLPNTLLMNDEIRQHIAGIINELESSEKDQLSIDKTYADFCYTVRREMDDRSDRKVIKVEHGSCNRKRILRTET